MAYDVCVGVPYKLPYTGTLVLDAFCDSTSLAVLRAELGGGGSDGDNCLGKGFGGLLPEGTLREVSTLLP